MENLFELNDLHAFVNVKMQKMAVKDKFGLCYGQTIEAWYQLV